MLKFIIFIALSFSPIYANALLKTQLEKITLTCTYPSEMSDGTKIPLGTKIKISLYGSSNQKMWFKLKTSKFCKFKVNASELSPGKVWFSVTATIDKKESEKSNNVNIDVEKSIETLINSPTFLGAK